VAALLAIAAVAAWAFWPKPAAPARATRFQVTLPENVNFSEYVSVSPDGHKLVFNATGAQSGLWIHDLDTLEWRKLPGTEEGRSPFWSPDSRFLGYGVGNDLKKVEITGGPPQTLCTISQPAGTGSWSKDGVIVFGPYRTAGPIRRVSSSGGVPTELTELSGRLRANYLPAFLPDGRHFLYLAVGSPDVTGIYAGSLDAQPSGQSRERILAATLAATYVEGNLFFMREGTLMAQPFDAGKLQLRGEPVPVAEHVATTGAIGIFSVSKAGVVAYRSGANNPGGLQTTWFDRQGKVVGTFGEPGPDRGLRLSPDATHAAGRDADQAANGDIWLLDFARGVRTRLTFRQSAGSYPVWSPDGSRVIFGAGTSPAGTLYEKAAGGAGEEKELLSKTSETKVPTSWSQDGRFLLYHTLNTPKTGVDLWALPLEGDRKPALLLGTQFDEGLAGFSPDGRWVAYISTESGRNEVYVRPFVPSGPSGSSLGDGKWQVSRDGVEGPAIPKWRSDGKEILFMGPGGRIMAVDVNGSSAAFQMGTPKQLFVAPPRSGWDVTADGMRFLMAVTPGQSQNAQTPITVVLNWHADLKK
jgi:Tol biopolymer transport system component